MMVKTSLPPGFRFHPTDVEMVWYYLKRKIMGKPFRFEAISDVELYKFAPWDLPDKSCLRSRDLEWYFFCPRDRKYANGSRTNRATETGYWKTTGKDRQIDHKCQIVGMKRTLIFHIGKVPKGTRTDWVMHEYRLQSVELGNAGFPQEAFVLCKIFQKSGPGPKNGEQYGAPFNEEEWNDFSDNEHADPVPCFHWHDQSFLLDHVQRQPVTFEVGEPSSSILDLSEAREMNSMPVQSVASDFVEPSMEITEVGEPQSVPGHSYADGLAVSDVVEPSMEIAEFGGPQSVLYADGLFLEELQEYPSASPPRQGIADDQILMSKVVCEDVNGLLDEDIETVYAQLDELSGPGIGLDDLLGQSGIGLDDFSFPCIMANENALDLLSEFSDEHYMELNDMNIQTRPPESANPNAIGYPFDNSSSFSSANYHFGLTDFNSTHPFANNSSFEDLISDFVSNVLPTVGRGSDVDILLTSEVPLETEMAPIW